MFYYAYHNREKLLRLRYLKLFGEQPDLENPRTLNEKILWLMLYSDTSAWTRLADKFRVREYVRECGYGSILNELYRVWDFPAEINFEGGGILPESFVLKTNNGYGLVIVVNNKATADLGSIRRKLARALSKKFGRMTGEHHYLGIKPCIIAEKYLPSDPALGVSLVDYKFYCFDGKPYYCMVCYDRRTANEVKTGLYDAHTWKNMDHYITGKYHDAYQRKIPPPVSLQLMLEAAARLASGFPQVRVDFYEVNGKPIFGELTFTSASGLDTGFTREFQEMMGARITLPPAVRKIR